jgi:hypothetical protein
MDLPSVEPKTDDSIEQWMEPAGKPNDDIALNDDETPWEVGLRTAMVKKVDDEKKAKQEKKNAERRRKRAQENSEKTRTPRAGKPQTPERCEEEETARRRKIALDKMREQRKATIFTCAPPGVTPETVFIEEPFNTFKPNHWEELERSGQVEWEMKEYALARCMDEHVEKGVVHCKDYKKFSADVQARYSELFNRLNHKEYSWTHILLGALTQEPAIFPEEEELIWSLQTVAIHELDTSLHSEALDAMKENREFLISDSKALAAVKGIPHLEWLRNSLSEISSARLADTHDQARKVYEEALERSIQKGNEYYEFLLVRIKAAFQRFRKERLKKKPAQAASDAKPDESSSEDEAAPAASEEVGPTVKRFFAKRTMPKKTPKKTSKKTPKKPSSSSDSEKEDTSYTPKKPNFNSRK